jgi:cystathionine beta-synthase
MNYYSCISDLIGKTPLLQIPSIRSDILVLLKLENLNPTGSVKDRSSLGLILDAENKGVLKKGMTIVESSSGNTAMGLATLAKERGYNFIAIVDEHAPKEKTHRLKVLGADVIFVDTKTLDPETSAVDFRRKKAKKLAAKNKNYINLDQYDNRANALFYSETMAEEIWQQTDGKITDLVGTIGTGSSLTGSAQKLKIHNPDIKVHAIEPKGSISFGKDSESFLQSGPGFPKCAVIPKNINFNVIDENYQVSDQECFNTMRYIAKNLGLFFGDSTGASLYKTIDIAEKVKKSAEPYKKVFVILASDGGNGYLSHAYNDGWMEKHQFLNASIEKKVGDFYKPYHEGETWGSQNVVLRAFNYFDKVGRL